MSLPDLFSWQQSHKMPDYADAEARDYWSRKRGRIYKNSIKQIMMLEVFEVLSSVDLRLRLRLDHLGELPDVTECAKQYLKRYEDRTIVVTRRGRGSQSTYEIGPRGSLHSVDIVRRTMRQVSKPLADMLEELEERVIPDLKTLPPGLDAQISEIYRGLRLLEPAMVRLLETDLPSSSLMLLPAKGIKTWKCSACATVHECSVEVCSCGRCVRPD